MRLTEEVMIELDVGVALIIIWEHSSCSKSLCLMKLKSGENFISFASSIGKLDAKDYVDTGMWKARQGGNGLISARDVKIKFTNCTSEARFKTFNLLNFSYLLEEGSWIRQKLLNETIILDIKTNVPIISIQPFGQEGYDYAVKIKTMNEAAHDDLQRMIAYQVRKFNACRKCLKCESICKAGAISIVGDRYCCINADKCVCIAKCAWIKNTLPAAVWWISI